MSLANEMVEGEICSGCQMPFKEEHGYPVLCSGCWREARRAGETKNIRGTWFVGEAQKAHIPLARAP